MSRGVDPVKAANLRRRHARLLLLEDRNALRFIEHAALHSRATHWRRTLQAISHISEEDVSVGVVDVKNGDQT